MVVDTEQIYQYVQDLQNNYLRLYHANMHSCMLVPHDYIVTTTFHGSHAALLLGVCVCVGGGGEDECSQKREMGGGGKSLQLIRALFPSGEHPAPLNEGHLAVQYLTLNTFHKCSKSEIAHFLQISLLFYFMAPYFTPSIANN